MVFLTTGDEVTVPTTATERCNVGDCMGGLLLAYVVIRLDVAAKAGAGRC